ncbi:MAG: hypothetical protein KDI32_00475 [Pseudomonadales bacterium]|jgi:hypothetical protein|nr:hypothetical protein [Pseudomonadales bacterium]
MNSRSILLASVLAAALPVFALATTPPAAAPAASTAASTMATTTTDQHQLMKDCSATAKTKHLAGKDRKEFMRTCLKKSQ